MTAPRTASNSDARKRQAEHAAGHVEHWDPAVASLIAQARREGAVEALRAAADDMRPIWWGDGDNGFYGALMHEPHPTLGPPHIRRVPLNDWLRARADRLAATDGGAE